MEGSRSPPAPSDRPRDANGGTLLPALIVDRRTAPVLARGPSKAPIYVDLGLIGDPFLWDHDRVDDGQRRGLIGRCATRRQRLPDSASRALTPGVTTRGASSAANASVSTNPATAQIAQDVRPAKLRRVSITACLPWPDHRVRTSVGDNNKPFLMVGKVTPCCRSLSPCYLD